MMPCGAKGEGGGTFSPYSITPELEATQGNGSQQREHGTLLNVCVELAAAGCGEGIQH